MKIKWLIGWQGVSASGGPAVVLCDWPTSGFHPAIRAAKDSVSQPKHICPVAWQYARWSRLWKCASDCTCGHLEPGEAPYSHVAASRCCELRKARNRSDMPIHLITEPLPQTGLLVLVVHNSAFELTGCLPQDDQVHRAKRRSTRAKTSSYGMPSTRNDNLWWRGKLMASRATSITPICR